MQVLPGGECARRKLKYFKKKDAGSMRGRIFMQSKKGSRRNRHFSRMTKSCIFKIFDLRKKANRNFRGNFLKNDFRHLKLFSNPPSWLARSRCHIGTFWKTKDWSSHFWKSQPFKFWYVEVHHQGRLKSTKTGISS